MKKSIFFTLMVIAMSVTTVTAQENKPVRIKLRSYSKTDFTDQNRFSDQEDMSSITAFAILHDGSFKITGNGMTLDLILTGSEWDITEVDDFGEDINIISSTEYKIDAVDTSDGEPCVLQIIELHIDDEYDPLMVLIQVNFNQISKMRFEFMGTYYE